MSSLCSSAWVLSRACWATVDIFQYISHYFTAPFQHILTRTILSLFWGQERHAANIIACGIVLSVLLHCWMFLASKLFACPGRDQVETLRIHSWSAPQMTCVIARNYAQPIVHHASPNSIVVWEVRFHREKDHKQEHLCLVLFL